MKFPWTIAAAMAIHSVVANANPSPVAPLAERWTTSVVADVEERLTELRLPFKVKSNAQTIRYIRDYAAVGVSETEAMLSRGTLLTPIFEHYLSIYQLPQELKYLPMVESGLKVGPRSPAGARGLWQLMEVTARQYRLKVNAYTDERLDPYKSTEAAMRILSDLYDQYQDWPLAIAAYNCGPGRVNKAIRLAGCNDYWEVRHHLPKETQRYVPAFIAATYIAKHYADHGLTVEMPEAVRVYKISTAMTFSQVAAACNSTIRDIRMLNPAFSGGVIPASDNGHYITVPAVSSPVFNKWLSRQAGYNHAAHAPKGSYHTTYVVAPGDRIEAVAQRFQCTVEDILRWNNLKLREIVINQELNIYLSRDFLLSRV
jgi:membrane-bound lytic murein transglycosylase D